MFRILTYIVCFVIIPVYGYSLWVELQHVPDLVTGRTFWFLSGGLMGWMAFIIWPASFFFVVLHEFNHWIVGWLLGAQVQSLGASVRSGGLIVYTYPYRWGIELIALAPYFLPIIPLVLLGILAIALPVFHGVLALVIGFFWTFFYCDMWQTLRVPQTDITKSGRFFSVVVIGAFNIVISGVILTAVFEPTQVTRFLWSGVPLHLWQDVTFYLSGL